MTNIMCNGVTNGVRKHVQNQNQNQSSITYLVLKGLLSSFLLYLSLLSLKRSISNAR